MYKHKLNQSGFTIVELLVVIVVIGIIAAITIISYGDVKRRAIIASLQSDLKNASTKIELYKTASDDEKYPENSSQAGLKASSGTTYDNYVRSGGNYCVQATNNGVTYHIDSISNTVELGACDLPQACDDLVGFVLVPGSPTYGTSDFCVMAFEAKADDNGDGIGDTTYATQYHSTWSASEHPISNSRKLVSTPQGWPVAVIDQDTAKYVAENYSAGCNTGCHLITEAEWMTIAQNILNNPVNWSGGAVGVGYVYSGHNDTSIGAALQVTDTNDAYNGTGNFAGDTSVTHTMIGDTQRRRLQLSNGEYIWDLAGNVWEWTSASQTGGWPAGMTGSNWYEWSAVLSIGSIQVDPRPSSTGIAGSDDWGKNEGVGVIHIRSADTEPRGFVRGGDKSSYWYWAPEYGVVGILSLNVRESPSTAAYNTGLRVTR